MKASIDVGAPDWSPETIAKIFTRDLSGFNGKRGGLEALLCRSTMPLLQRFIADVSGVEHLRAEHDPFLIVANHVSRIDAIATVVLMHYLRGGSRIFFMADWNFQLIPFVGLLMRRAQVITIAKKSARPKFLNVFKRFFEHPVAPLERARRHLLSGSSVGIYPEGTVNRDRSALLSGHYGAARLALETGVPVVPVGIRFDRCEVGEAPSLRDKMRYVVGAPLETPSLHGEERASRAEVFEWHDHLMNRLAQLSGKRYEPRAARTPARRLSETR